MGRVGIAKHLAYAVILGVLIVGFAVQMNLGVADNGDFTRAMTVFTSGPVRITPNWPDPGTQGELWSKRFFQYYIPHWKLDFPENLSLTRRFKSSAYLLWFPGVLLNQALYNKSILNLEIMSIVAKIVLILLVLIVFRYMYAKLSAREAILLYFCSF